MASTPPNLPSASTPPTVKDRMGAAPVTAVITSVIIFLLIPLAQRLSSVPLANALPPAGQDLPPPLIEDDYQPPPEIEEDISEPELEEAPPPPSLEALEFALNPDVTGFASGEIRVDFEMNQDDLVNQMIFNIEDLDERPSPILQIEPQYPEAMRRAGIGGRVILRFEVDTEGRPRNIIVENSPNPAFDRPSIDAVRQWRFTIGRKNGKPVEFRMRLPLAYTPPN